MEDPVGGGLAEDLERDLQARLEHGAPPGRDQLGLGRLQPEPLSHEPAKESTVSPDGRSLVYMRWNSFGTKPANGRALFSVRMEGTHNHRLTPWKLGAGDHPALAQWSPGLYSGRQPAGSPHHRRASVSAQCVTCSRS